MERRNHDMRKLGFAPGVMAHWYRPPSGTLGLKRSWVQTQWRAGEFPSRPDLGSSPKTYQSSLLLCAPKKEEKKTRVSEAPNVL